MNDPYVQLAKATIEEYVKNGRLIKMPQDLPKEMLTNKAGVFVSIHAKRGLTQTVTQTDAEGELRGCIGTFLATRENIAEEIIDNAVAACSRDYRFSPITSNELPNLEISVDILGEPEPIATSDWRLAIGQLDAKKYGVIIKSENGQTGLLLPDLPGVDSPEQQIAICRQKAGISPTEPIYLYRFEVKRHQQT